MRSVFLSYAREDLDWAQEKARTLRQVGVAVFLDVDTLRSGDRWKVSIGRAIGEADRFIVGWSAHARESACVIHEIETALEIRSRRGPSDLIAMDLLDATPLPPQLADIHAESILVARDVKVPGTLLFGMGLAVSLWAASARFALVPAFWAAPACLLLVAGLTLLYLYYVSPGKLRRVRGSFEAAGAFFADASSSRLLGTTSDLLERFYGGPWLSKRAIGRTILVACLAVLVPNVLGTLVFLSGSGGSTHYLNALRFFSWLDVIVIASGPFIANMAADLISVSAARLLIRRATASATLLGRAGWLATMALLTLVLCWLPLLMVTSVDFVAISASGWRLWPSWLGEILGIIVSGQSQIYTPIETLVLRSLGFCTAASACLPLLVCSIVFIAAIVARPARGALFRMPGRILLAMSRDARGPLAVAYVGLAALAVVSAVFESGGVR